MSDDAEYESDKEQASSSISACPSATPVYPNLPHTAPDQAKFSGKTRRVLFQKDSDECMRILTQVFKHSKYKGKQKAIVEAAYGGADVLVVAPTGMGKSLCFQVPAVADKRGVSIVVSPLLALMQNQIESLRLKKVEVASISSQVSPSEKEDTYRHLQAYDVRIKLLYVTPEKLCTQEFINLMDVVYENNNLNRLVVDEAHCISEWGHDFREEYRRLGTFRTRYPDVPIMALTATATAAVQKDIIKSLKLVDSRLFVALHPFNRANLFYEIRYLSNPQLLNQMADIFEYITTLYRRRGQSSSGIIYCRTRNTCNDLSSYLRGKGINSRPYHRGIGAATLNQTLKGWTTGEGVDLVVATIAFGLGIDKGDVRYVIHYDVPKSFEGYYQETGRAGRDGHPAKCILYYSREDVIMVKKFVGNPNPHRIRDDDDDGPSPTQRATGSLESLINFAESTTLCRHISICRYFGEPIDETDENIVKTYCNRMCDVCKYPEKTRARVKNLSSIDGAMANVPPSRPPCVNPAAPQSRQSPFNHVQFQRQDRESSARGSFGAPKRPAGGPDLAESSTKKPKTHTPILVTKPFQSTRGLSKPFKPPSFVRPVAKSDSSNILLQPSIPQVSWEESLALKRQAASRNNTDGLGLNHNAPPVLRIDETVLSNMEMDDGEISPVIELPKVNMLWQVSHSNKAPINDRKIAFEALRRSLYQVLILGTKSNECWSKLSDYQLDEEKRNQILFKVATELETQAISLSSTFEGYKIRVDSLRQYVKVLSNVTLWDSKKRDFEDSQDVINILRRYLSSFPKKGKERA